MESSLIEKYSIFYFSGTGNAKQIVIWFSEFINKKNIICDIFDIAKTDVRKLEKFESNTTIVFISPIHGFNFPKITLKFISNFPKGKNKVVLMNTRAGMKIGNFVTPGLTGIAFMVSSLMLIIKGYKIIGQIPFDMPSNWISIHPALNEKTVTYLNKVNYNRVEKHANKLLSGKKDFIACRDLIQDILIAPISLGYYIVGRFIIAKSFYASVECDNCRLCEKSCPVSAIIQVEERPYWTFKCESCMRCMNYCPKKAIETAHGLFVVLYVLYSILISYLTTYLLFDEFFGDFRFIATTLIFVFLLIVLYKFQHKLLRNKFIGKFISYTSLTYFKFWGRYRSNNKIK